MFRLLGSPHGGRFLKDYCASCQLVASNSLPLPPQFSSLDLSDVIIQLGGVCFHCFWWHKSVQNKAKNKVILYKIGKVWLGRKGRKGSSWKSRVFAALWDHGTRGVHPPQIWGKTLAWKKQVTAANMRKARLPRFYFQVHKEATG